MYVDNSTNVVVEAFDNIWFVVTFLMFVSGCMVFTAVYVLPILVYDYIAIPLFKFFFGHLL